MGDTPTDFFVSYTHADKAWAEWIAYALEAGGFTTVIQAWDFRPGSNFVVEMQKAAATAERTIMVLSPEYIQSQFAAPEWAAAFANDPKGFERKLVPVCVARCDPPGLLKPIVHIDLVGLDEAAARKALVEGVERKRAKPSGAPAFPGAAIAGGTPPAPKTFPGPAAQPAAGARSAHMPKIARPASDADKRQLLRKAMEVTREHFRIGMAALERDSQGISTDLEEVSSRDFFAEIFMDGQTKCRCRIWQGGLTAENGISYAEGSTVSISGGANEILTVTTEGSDVFMRSLMSPVAFGVSLADLNLQHLSPEDTAEYLWRRFTHRLG